jgi:quinol monooxygenase YgiN
MSGPAVIAKITAQPGKRDELVSALQAIVAAVADEPGTIEYVMHTDANDPDLVWFYERYDSAEALQAHGSSETMKRVGADVRELAAARPELIMLDIVGGKGL